MKTTAEILEERAKQERDAFNKKIAEKMAHEEALDFTRLPHVTIENPKEVGEHINLLDNVIKTLNSEREKLWVLKKMSPRLQRGLFLLLGIVLAVAISRWLGTEASMEQTPPIVDFLFPTMDPKLRAFLSLVIFESISVYVFSTLLFYVWGNSVKHQRRFLLKLAAGAFTLSGILAITLIFFGG